VFKKVENKAPLTWTWKKMSTLTLFQSFCVFGQLFAFKNTLKNTSKMDFIMVVFGTPSSVVSPSHQN
jgi:hypothetical protein